MNNRKGFTLMEVIITIAILGIVLSALYNILFFQIKTFNLSDKKSVAQTDVRYISDFISNELRYATEVEILPTMPAIPNSNYKYIYVDNKQIYQKDYYNPPGKKLNIEDRKPSYNLAFSANNENVVDFDLGTDTENFKLNTSINLVNTTVIAKNGLAVRYKLPEFTGVLSLLDKSNRFWYDLVKSSLEGTLHTATNYGSTQTVEGGSLALNIKSTGTSNGGSSMFVPLDSDSFMDANGDLKSYSITVDAKVNGGGGGYGILINGILNNNNQDSGYMFQFDPGAGGFLLREINLGSHVNSKFIGATRALKGKEDGSMGIYLPSHINNAKFKLDASGSTWFERYKTEVKAQTQADGSIIVRAVIIDENGNRSNEMWFGDFGKTNLNGTEFAGKKLDKYANNGGNIFGLRVWDNEGGKAKTDFYNIAIGSAEPAPKKTFTTIASNKITIQFDDKLDGDSITNKDLFTIKDKKGIEYEISAANKVNDNYEIALSIVPKKDKNGIDIKIPTDLTIEYKKQSVDTANLKDSFGNLVNDFKFHEGIYIKQ